MLGASHAYLVAIVPGAITALWLLARPTAADLPAPEATAQTSPPEPPTAEHELVAAHA
jgi:hypothetical protein